MDLKCPVCNNQHLDAFEFHGEEVDCCHKCGGLWFENGELNSALSTADNDDDAVRAEENLGKHLGKTRIHCIHCDIPLERYHLMQEFQLEVDVCHKCSGVFIEGHERDKVVTSPKVRQLVSELNGKVGFKTWVFQFLSQMPVEFNLKPKTTPWVTYTLILLNVLIFLMHGMSDKNTLWVYEHFSIQAGQLAAGEEPWTLLTHMFLHGGWMHLIGNMYFLYVVGDNLEDAMGRGNYLLSYLGCGIAAALAQLASDHTSMIYNVGASGAIAGLFGMYLLWFRYASLTFMFVVYQKKLSPMLFFAIWLMFNLLGVLMQGQGVAYWAHIGGFVAGLVLGLALKSKVMANNPTLALLNQPEVKVSR